MGPERKSVGSSKRQTKPSYHHAVAKVTGTGTQDGARFINIRIYDMFIHIHIHDMRIYVYVDVNRHTGYVNQLNNTAWELPPRMLENVPKLSEHT